MKKKFTDTKGKTLSRDEVEELALGNVIASMSAKELASFYLGKQKNAEILQWATDENGEFPA
jgi:hypothetical protein